jgi:hypothetical protein
LKQSALEHAQIFKNSNFKIFACGVLEEARGAKTRNLNAGVGQHRVLQVLQVVFPRVLVLACTCQCRVSRLDVGIEF